MKLLLEKTSKSYAMDSIRPRANSETVKDSALRTRSLNFNCVSCDNKFVSHRPYTGYQVYNARRFRQSRDISPSNEINREGSDVSRRSAGGFHTLARAKIRAKTLRD